MSERERDSNPDRDHNQNPNQNPGPNPGPTPPADPSNYPPPPDSPPAPAPDPEPDPRVVTSSPWSGPVSPENGHPLCSELYVMDIETPGVDMVVLHDPQRDTAWIEALHYEEDPTPLQPGPRRAHN